MTGFFATTDATRWRQRTGAVQAATPDQDPCVPPGARRDGSVLTHVRAGSDGGWRPAAPPVTSPDGALTLVLSGEIHNYRELADRYGWVGIASGRDLLVALLRRHPDRIGELRGMFAFVAWDHQRQELLAARDAFGIASLYVLRHASGELTLATQISHLVEDGDARLLDRLGVGAFLAFGHTGPGLTAYAAIQKVEPGALHRWRRTGLGFTRSAKRFVVTPVLAPDLETALRESVRVQLGSGAQVGTFLDASIDSTLLACLASQEQPGLPSYTAVLTEQAGCEAADVASHNAALLGVEHHLVPTSLSDLAGAARSFVQQQGEPFADPSTLPGVQLSLAAGGHLEAVLDVVGARQLFGGSRQDRVSSGLAGMRLGRLLRPQQVSDSWGLRQTGQAWERTLGAVLAGGGFAGHAALRNGDLALLGRLDRRVRADVEALTSSGWQTAAPDAAGRAHCYDLDVVLPNQALEATVGGLRLAGLQGRLPFLEPAAVAAARLPNTSGAPLRSLLLALLPGVRLASRSASPTMDVRSLVDHHFADQVERQLVDPAAALSQWVGHPDLGVARRRAARSPAFAFRLAMLDHWQVTFGRTVLWQR